MNLEWLEVFFIVLGIKGFFNVVFLYCLFDLILYVSFFKVDFIVLKCLLLFFILVKLFLILYMFFKSWFRLILYFFIKWLLFGILVCWLFFCFDKYFFFSKYWLNLLLFEFCISWKVLGVFVLFLVFKVLEIKVCFDFVGFLLWDNCVLVINDLLWNVFDFVIFGILIK